MGGVCVTCCILNILWRGNGTRTMPSGVCLSILDPPLLPPSPAPESHRVLHKYNDYGTASVHTPTRVSIGACSVCFAGRPEYVLNASIKSSAACRGRTGEDFVRVELLSGGVRWLCPGRGNGRRFPPRDVGGVQAGGTARELPVE